MIEQINNPITAQSKGITAGILKINETRNVKNGITEWIKNWKNNDWKTSSKKTVKNKDLWVVLDDLNSTYKISWKWIKAHQDDEKDDVKYNNLADELARRGYE